MAVLGKPISTKNVCDYVQLWVEDNLPGLGGLRRFTVTEGPDSAKAAGVEIVISPAPGSGLSQEWMVEGLSWQFRVYGPQSRDPKENNAHGRAEELAWALDRMMILLENHGESINGLRILSSQRYGSAPTSMPPDPSGRYSYVATYVLEVASGL